MPKASIVPMRSSETLQRATRPVRLNPFSSRPVRLKWTVFPGAIVARGQSAEDKERALHSVGVHVAEDYEELATLAKPFS